jgi:hypothetical protein
LLDEYRAQLVEGLAPRGASTGIVDAAMLSGSVINFHFARSHKFQEAHPTVSQRLLYA